MKSIEGLTQEEERAAEVFRALGNPARVRIVSELARRGACVTGELVDLLPLAQSTVSQHLKVLKEAGIIQGTIDGDQCYCLNPEVMRWVAAFSFELCCPAEPGESECSAEAGETARIAAGRPGGVALSFAELQERYRIDDDVDVEYVLAHADDYAPDEEMAVT